MILVSVSCYCRFSLSYRNVSEFSNERDIFMHPTTIMSWMHEYGNLIYQIWKKKNKSTRHIRHLDETYIKGEWHCLYRDIDSDRYTLDIQLRKTRHHQTVYMFMKRLVKAFGEPTVLTTDKAYTLLCTIKNLKIMVFYMHMKHYIVKHFNNLTEQDHRHVTRYFTKSAGRQSRALKRIKNTICRVTLFFTTCHLYYFIESIFIYLNFSLSYSWYSSNIYMH
ncbi:IS6 family transposase [Bacillus cereus group sp. MYBK234-1]|uniref:IS6 family transposase n=1 Tax=unclassified Bacillus cereus group TaxID=2750818 RepID=UPI003F793843